MSDAPHVVLVGGGHAHLQVIRGAAALHAQGARVSVVCPRRFWYSGLATAVLAGTSEPEDDQIDVADVARRHGVEWIDAQVARMAPAGRQLVLDNDRTLAYTAASFNVGSEVALPGTPAPADERLWPVKPIANIADLRTALRAHRGSARVRVVGGGPTGCEIMASLAGLCRRESIAAELALSHAGPELLPAAPAGARAHMARHLRAAGVRLEPGRRLHFHAAGEPRFDDEDIDADFLVVATGLRAAPLAQSLAQGESDGIPVTEHLHHPDHPDLFAAGDCAHFLPRPLPKVGVFGVRQGPVLLGNLVATIAGQALAPFRPQRRYLTILNLGDGTGLALRGGLWWHGRAMLRLKHRLDRRFLHTQRC